MNPIDTGGAAFPLRAKLPNDEYCYNEGMSLRDYLAATFAAAWVVALSIRHNDLGWSDAGAAVEANRLGLLQADEMIRAREDHHAT